MSAKDKAARRPAGHYVLDVRVRAAQVAWLEASPTWTDSGRVGYETERGVFVPGPADLARAEYELNALRRYPVSAERVFGDAGAWQEAMRAKLARAKLLLRAPDDSAAFLAAAAVCLGRPPGLPFPRVEEDGRSLPEEARALARLLARPGGPPPHAHLVATLPAFEARLVSAWKRAPELPPALVVDLPRRLRAQGVAPERVTALVEALAAHAPGMLRALERRAQATPAHSAKPKRRRKPGVADRNAAQALRDRLLPACIDAVDGDPEIVGRLARFVEAQLARFPTLVCLDRLVVQPLSGGLARLPAPYLLAWFDLLEETAETLWTTPEAMARAAGAPAPPPGDARFWDTGLSARWEHAVAPGTDLLARLGGEVALTAELIRRGGTCLYLTGAEAARRLVQLLDLLELPLDFRERDLLVTVANRSSGPLFRRLAEVLSAWTPPARRILWEGLWPIDGPEIAGKLARVLAQGEALGALAERLAASEELRRAGMEVAVEAAQSDDPLRLPTACAVLERRLPDTMDSWDFDQRLRAGLAVAGALAPGDPAAYRAIVEAVRTHRSLEESRVAGAVVEARPTLESLPGLTAALRVGIAHDAGRVLQVLMHLRYLQPFLRDEAIGAPLAALDGAGEGVSFDDPEWAALVALDPGLSAPAAAYLRAQRLLGGETGVPPGVRRFALDRAARLAREREFLQALPGADPRRARLTRLEAQLADTERLRRRAADEARERLTAQGRAAWLAAAERQVRRAIQTRLEAVIGPLPTGRPFDDDLANAAILLSTITQNRRLLIRLLRAASARRDREFVARHPANRRFLAGLAARDVAVDRWLSEGRRSTLVPSVGRCSLWLSRDPIAILQMGNYFGTCLSAGDFNAFSTVANACELNKRVLFVRDGAGRIVARKLIGVGEDGRLLGFRTYTAGESEAASDALRETVRAYLLGFASACGLERADEGVVPSLFAQAWYDDGAVSWADGGESAGKIEP